MLYTTGTLHNRYTQFQGWWLSPPSKQALTLGFEVAVGGGDGSGKSWLLVVLVEVMMAAASRQEKREGSYHPRFLPHKVSIEKNGERRTHLCAHFPPWALHLSAGGVAIVAVRRHLLVLSLSAGTHS
jgi:hypothetical protein